MGFYRRFRKRDVQENAGAQANEQPSDGSANASSAAQGSAVSENAAPAAAPAERPPASGRADATGAPAASAAPSGATAPAQVKEISAEELKTRMDAGNAPLLLDVREPWEHQIVNIDPAKLMPMNTVPAQMKELDKDAEIVVYCHHGQRSWNVANYLLQQGFTNVKNLTGGIDSWVRRVDKTKRTY